jgi:hypothetical protein
MPAMIIEEAAVVRSLLFVGEGAANQAVSVLATADAKIIDRLLYVLDRRMGYPMNSRLACRPNGPRQ